MPVVSGLLARLGLPFEYQRMQIIADNYEAAVLFREVQTAANAYDTERVEKLLQRLVGLIPMENIHNRQEIKRSEAINHLSQGRITREEYVEQIKEALEYTVALENIKNLREGYMTCNEIGCIYHPDRQRDPVRRPDDQWIDVL